MSDRPFPHPRENPHCAGHDDAFAAFERARKSGRLPHAWLLQGPRGIGKATLAYRLARHLLAGPDENADDPDSPVFRRIAHGSEPDLHVLSRRPHPRTGKLQNHIVIETVRETIERMHETASGTRGRVIIVDAVDILNVNAANSFLKLLEEPPPSTVLLLVCHRPGAVLATIRSRCAQMTLRPPDTATTARIITPWLDDRPAGEIDALARLAEGSPGRALKLAGTGFLEAYAALLEAASPQPPDAASPQPHARLDPTLSTRAIFDILAGMLDRGDIHLAGDLLRQTLHRLCLSASGVSTGAPLVDRESERLSAIAESGPLDHWASLWDKLSSLSNRVELLNNDARQELMLAAIDLVNGSATPNRLSPI